MSLLVRFPFIVLLVWAGALSAAEDTYQFSNPEEEAQFKQLTEELRCLVCQNQNLADSNAELATDLRNEVYGMVSEGRDNQEIIDFLVDRYGDFVRYRPPVKSTTYLLWFGPFLLLVIAALLLVRAIRRRSHGGDLEFSEADRQRLEQVLRATEQKKDGGQ